MNRPLMTRQMVKPVNNTVLPDRVVTSQNLVPTKFDNNFNQNTESSCNSGNFKGVFREKIAFYFWSARPKIPLSGG